MNKIYKCYFDGSCEPINPDGKMGYGVYITYGLENEYRKSEFVKAKKGNTNNIAEYLGFIMVLKLLRKKTGSLIYIYGDSKMVIEQMNKRWKIKKGGYVPFAKEALKLLANLQENNTIVIKWIPREQNTEADKLSKK